MEFCKESYHIMKIKLENNDLFVESSAMTIKHLILEIKQEYENFLQVFEDASQLHSFLSREIVTVAGEEQTQRNINEYKSSLVDKLKILQEDNTRLKSVIKNEENARLELIKTQNAVLEAKKYEHLQGIGCTGMSQMKLCEILHLTPTQWADKECLQEKLDEIQEKRLSLQNDLNFRFTQQKHYKTFLTSTLRKESECEAHGMINNTLKAQVKRLKLAIEASQISANHEYKYGRRSGKSMARVVQMVLNNFDDNDEVGVEKAKELSKHINETIQDDNIKPFDHSRVSINKASSNMRPVVNSDVVEVDDSLKCKLDDIQRPKSFEEKKSFTDDDPMKEQEAEMTMDFLEHFSLLFTAKKFEEAALHAIYSPKGILRTPRTLKYFKHVDILLKKSGDKIKSYLLYYCTLLMSTIDIVGKQPSIWETIECFKSAISEERIDLVEYWLSKAQTSPTEDIGFLLFGSCSCKKRKCNCKSVILSEIIFKRIGAHHQVVHVMLHQGRYATALAYALKDAKYTNVDFARLLEDELICREFSWLLPTIPDMEIERIIIALTSSGHEDKAFMITKQFHLMKKALKFTCKQFGDWNGNIDVAERFGSLCVQNGLEEIGYEFVTACLLWSVVNTSYTAIKAISN